MRRENITGSAPGCKHLEQSWPRGRTRFMIAVVIHEGAERGAAESRIGLWPRAVVRFQ